MQTETRNDSVVTCPHSMKSGLAEAAIASWMRARNAEDFPYDAVVAEYRRVGKHFVASELLETLDGVRLAFPTVGGSEISVQLLDRFLDTVLDKWDGRYANPTYLGLSLLPLSEVDNDVHDVAAARRRYDRLFVQLIADASRFEIAAADGATDFLPQMRPAARTTAKRCRLGLQIAGPAARRLGLAEDVDVSDPIVGARRLWANVSADLTPAERRTLQLSMLPVSLVHDEYQFIRALQSFEATFALIAVELRAAIRALTEGDVALATGGIKAAAATLHEAAPLFSLVATMQLEAFQTFREFTEGASAIQSRNYKLVESLCRQPDPARLNSAPYLSVPEVRQRVMAGQVTLDEAFSAARASGRFEAGEVDELEWVMRRFAGTLLRWRRTHHRIAVRMLGERTGTGYTEGAAYLADVREIPVFRSVPMGDDTTDSEARDFEQGNEIAPARPREIIPPRGRCPFSAGGGFLGMSAVGA